jgi:2,3-bisphosphoglycerate-independent phosphoglycerate mutase
MKYNGPLVLIIMDGVGISNSKNGNAVDMAYKPTLDNLINNYKSIAIKAHGLAVGLPSDSDMGNSEVGHNAIGSGQIYNQGAKLVNESINSGAIFKSQTWMDIINQVNEKDSTLHFIGLLSDGNVHSNINHLISMLNQAKAQNVKKARVHVILDGRDVDSTSALKYIDQLEKALSDINTGGYDYKIASGGGRMQITMDRYEANWNMVKDGWDTHVLGIGRRFENAKQAVEAYRKENIGVIDQDLPAFVISDKSDAPVGTINDGDAVIFFNFRGDRSIEISKAFDEGDEFSSFDRQRVPKVIFAGMLEYDSDLRIPRKYLVNPPVIKNTLGEFLVKNNVTQLAISETQKYGHVTYFFNGNRSSKFSEELEEYINIPSDVVPFEQRPWMKSAEITDVMVEKIKSGNWKFIRVNFPNGDMVGHTGNLEATIVGVESVDIALSRILKAVDSVGGVALITADHGNAEEMYDLDKNKKEVYDEQGNIKPKTSHTVNPVPFIIYDNTANRDGYSIKNGDFGLSNIASTITDLLGLSGMDCWQESMISFTNRDDE